MPHLLILSTLSFHLMTDSRRERVMSKEAEEIAVFRFGVIAPLVCRQFENKSQEKEARKEILAKQWKQPDGNLKRIPARTLRFWLARYRQYGLDGLYDGMRKSRPSKGISKALSEQLLADAEKLRRELPSRSVSTIVRLLASKGVDISSVCTRTLTRQLKQRGATKKKIERQAGYFQRWEQIHVNDLWQGDTAHGIWLEDPTDPNQVKKTKLIAFIDDASRVCTHAQFYFDEQLPSLIDTFSKALLKRGKPRRLLLDNAFIYHSSTLGGMCAQLRIELSFCRPRRPQGKGKIERWIKSVKERFYPEATHAGLTTLTQLNEAFQAWLEKEYHRKTHTELDRTPIERWQQDAQLVDPVSQEEIRRALMLRAKRRVHENTATVSLDARDYQVSPLYAGEVVEVRWHPDDIDAIEVWLDEQFIEIAQQIARQPRVECKMQIEEKDKAPLPLASAKSYLYGMAEEKTQSVAAFLRPDDLLSLEEFVQLLVSMFERPLEQTELDKLGQFFKQFSPIKKRETQKALQQAIDVKGRQLHLRFYLHHLEHVLQAGRR